MKRAAELPVRQRAGRRSLSAYRAKASIAKMAEDAVCDTCGGIGYVLDTGKRPADQPCPDCGISTAGRC